MFSGADKGKETAGSLLRGNLEITFGFHYLSIREN